MINAIPEDKPSDKLPSAPSSMLGEDTPVESPASVSAPSSPKLTQSSQKSYPNTLANVLDLHTARRMKAPSSDSTKVKQGVSIPSQRRFLYYWTLLLSDEAPSYFWDTERLLPSPGKEMSILSMPVLEKRPRPKVRLTEIKIRMKELSNVRTSFVRAANAVLDRTSMSKSVTAKTDPNTHVWVSLARYDDDFVETLERWERYTRLDDDNGLGHMGRRRPGTDHFGKEMLTELFNDGRWDNKKMVRSFARMGATGEPAVVKSETEEVMSFSICRIYSVLTHDDRVARLEYTPYIHCQKPTGRVSRTILKTVGKAQM